MNTEMLIEMILFPFSLREDTVRAGLLQEQKIYFEISIRGRLNVSVYVTHQFLSWSHEEHVYFGLYRLGTKHLCHQLLPVCLRDFDTVVMIFMSQTT
jgi:hypothetical protein